MFYLSCKLFVLNSICMGNFLFYFQNAYTYFQIQHLFHEPSTFSSLKHQAHVVSVIFTPRLLYVMNENSHLVLCWTLTTGQHDREVNTVRLSLQHLLPGESSIVNIAAITRMTYNQRFYCYYFLEYTLL